MSKRKPSAKYTRDIDEDKEYSLTYQKVKILYFKKYKCYQCVLSISRNSWNQLDSGHRPHQVHSGSIFASNCWWRNMKWAASGWPQARKMRIQEVFLHNWAEGNNKPGEKKSKVENDEWQNRAVGYYKNAHL